MLKKFLVGMVAIVAIALAYGIVKYGPQLPIATGYAAKKMCSYTFVAGLDQDMIQSEDLDFFPLRMTKTEIDQKAMSATSSLFGLATRTAVFRNDVGCILLQGDDDHNVDLTIDRTEIPESLPWPLGASVYLPDSVEGVDLVKLNHAINDHFDPSLGMDSVKTRAVVVAHKGRIIAEKYANGIDAETELLGWSMTKSITSAIVGIMVKNRKMSLDDKDLFKDWTDTRKDISLKDMVQMQDGLDFEEEYSRLSDATKMLYKSENSAALALSKPLAHQPGTRWYYSGGTTNLLQALLRDKLGEDYHAFPYDSLFSRIGMTSAVLESDESGLYIGSSYCYATTRDWARFGLLFLRNGNWFGDQVVDTSWVDFVRKPASNSGGVYGGQFWLNVDHSNFRDAPADLYMCNGFNGQHVFIIPSMDLVIVRMGLASYPDFVANDFLRDIVACFD